MLASSPAGAADPKAAPPEGAAEGKIARAKDLFDKGYALLKAGDCERALGLFKRSLDEVPSSSSTMNAAYCLNDLKRADEALELYEDLLTTYGAELSDADKTVIEAAVAALRKKVGSIELSANVDGGQVIIDGRARGKLPLDAPVRVTEGEHTVRIRQDGYELFERKVHVAAGAAIAVDAWLLPPAPRPPSGSAVPSSSAYPFISAFGGFAISDSLGSTAEQNGCRISCSPAVGALFGFRSGYRLEPGVALEISFGYLSVVSKFSRTVNASFRDQNSAVTARFELNDALRIRGSFFGFGASYRLALGPRIGLMGRATAGLLSAQSLDPFTGTARTNGGRVPIAVAGRGQVLVSQPAFLMPEFGVEARWGGLLVGVLLGVVFMTSEGPPFTHYEVGVEPTCSDKTPSGSVGCVPNQFIGGGEHAYGKFMLWVPGIAVGYAF
jgi:tetratricopeptide (TPR) repeat protein